MKAGRASEFDGGIMSSIIDEIMSVAGKRSYLKPVCSNILENLISQVSAEVFGEQIWPKIRDKLTPGWEGCTLDRITLLLVCKDKFPEIVNKKFIKKHWGFPIFSEENDDKFVQAILTANEKSDVVTEKIVPFILSSGRDINSVWSSLGEKLYGSGLEKKQDIVSQRKLQAVSILTKLTSLTTEADQIISLILIPSVTKCIFQEVPHKQEPFGKAIDNLVAVLFDKLKAVDADILHIIQKVFEQEATVATGSGSQEGKLRFIYSNNFLQLVNLMEQKEAKEYVSVLISIVKGQEKWKFLSKSKTKQERQIDWCLRQLQITVCSRTQTSPEMQKSVLSLFLRFGFFKCSSKVKDIEHCDAEASFTTDSNARQLCVSFFFKCLDHLSTLNTDQTSKTEHLSNYLELLTHLAYYLQSLISCKKVTSISQWPAGMLELWTKTLEHIDLLTEAQTSVKQNNQDTAFLLLYSYLGFHMLSDFKTSSELLQDVFVCEEKSSAKVKKSIKIEATEEPQWIEVLTEILLQLLSLQSHLARIVSSMVFRLIVTHMNAEAVKLIVQTLIPKKAGQDDAGGVLVEDDDADQDGNDEGSSSDEEELLDDDVPDEEDDDDDDDDADDDADDAEDEDEEESDQDEEGMEVDEQFRESVKQALGSAGVPDENESDDEDLPDLSDSEMFKFDEVLAEVFRQRKKSGGKKAREEKKKELGNFRLRVLDLVEVMIKSEHCGFFLLDLLRPLLLLILTSRGTEEQSARDKAKSLFNLLKSHSKGLTDTRHDSEGQMEIFQELVDLARTVNDSSQLPFIATACTIVIKTSPADCLEILSQTLTNVTNKKQSKPLPVFFTALFEMEPTYFQPVSLVLLNCLSNEEAKLFSRTLSCTLLASLAKKTGVFADPSKSQWMAQAASFVTKELETINKDDLKAMFLKEVMSLTVALLNRTDILTVDHFGDSIKIKLSEIKSKMNTDLRRLANKIIAALDRLKSQLKKKQDKDQHSQKRKKGKEVKEDLEKELIETKKKKRKTKNVS